MLLFQEIPRDLYFGKSAHKRCRRPVRWAYIYFINNFYFEKDYIFICYPCNTYDITSPDKCDFQSSKYFLLLFLLISRI